MEQKKILILGANHETIPLVLTLNKLGIYTIVTDYNPDAPSKKYACKCYDIDCMDLDALVRLCKEEKVNGIMLGVADSLVKVYQLLCEKLNYFSYSSKLQSEVLSNKILFNEYCAKFNIPVIPNYKVELERFEDTANSVQYPVFVKPVDGNSGKGASICKNKIQLKDAIIRAKSNAPSGKYLIEKYMQCDDLLLYYTFMNGEYWLSAIADRYTIKQKDNGSKVCVGAIYPSKYKDKYFEDLHEKLKKLFQHLKIRNGVFLISAFYENEKFHLYDPGFRLQGEAPDIHINHVAGYDQKEALLNLALNGNMGKEVLKNDYFSENIHATIWVLLKPGKIKSIMGLKELEANSYVFYISQRFFEGDEVDEKVIGTEGQVFARIYCSFGKVRNINKIIEDIENSIDVIDVNGNSLKLKGFADELKKLED